MKKTLPFNISRSTFKGKPYYLVTLDVIELKKQIPKENFQQLTKLLKEKYGAYMYCRPRGGWLWKTDPSDRIIGKVKFNFAEKMSHGGQITNDGTHGGVVRGSTHQHGGVKAIVVTDDNRPVELEDKEAILSRKTMESEKLYEFEGKMMKPQEIASSMNEEHGGAALMQDGGSIQNTVLEIKLVFTGPDANNLEKLINPSELSLEKITKVAENTYNTFFDYPFVKYSVFDKNYIENAMSIDISNYLKEENIDAKIESVTITNAAKFEEYEKGGVINSKLYLPELTNSSDTKEIAKIIRQNLKNRYPSAKFSVTSDIRKIKVALMAANFNPFSEKVNKDKYLAVNPYNIDSDKLSEKGKEVFAFIKKISDHYNWDNSDAMTDYFDVNFYLRLGIGKWDKPFVLTKRKQQEKKEEKLKGGLADNKTPEEIAKKHGKSLEYMTNELSEGIQIEMEHTNDKEKAREIAMDHLFEDAEYYKKLAKIETNVETQSLASQKAEIQAEIEALQILLEIADTKSEKEEISAEIEAMEILLDIEKMGEGGIIKTKLDKEIERQLRHQLPKGYYYIHTAGSKRSTYYYCGTEKQLDDYIDGKRIDDENLIKFRISDHEAMTGNSWSHEEVIMDYLPNEGWRIFYDGDKEFISKDDAKIAKFIVSIFMRYFKK